MIRLAEICRAERKKRRPAPNPLQTQNRSRHRSGCVVFFFRDPSNDLNEAERLNVLNDLNAVRSVTR